MVDVVYKTVLSTLLAIVAFFCVRLVDRLEKLEAIVWQLRQDVVILQTVEGVRNVRRN